MAIWFLVGDMAIHYILYIWSESLINSMVLVYIHCLTIVFPTAYTILNLLSYSMIPI